VNILAAFIIIGVLAFLLLPSINSRPAPPRSECANNLKQIAVALRAYHDDYGSFPPAFVTDKKGRPMHSWRVLILPFMEQQALYEEYDFDEPWNGPNNRRFLDVAIPTYRCPSDDSGKVAITNYLAIVGPGTAWPGSSTVKDADVVDGPSDTIHVVEVRNSGIHWIEPRDLGAAVLVPAINPKKGGAISSGHREGANVLFCDGKVEFLTDETGAAAVRAMITTSAGDEVYR